MDRGPLPLALAVYGALSLVTVGVALARGASPLELDDAWLGLSGWAAHGVSAALGWILALGTVWSTRRIVTRWRWARALHADLRPALRGTGDGTLLVLGLASGVAEELFFRGVLAPMLGLWLSSLAFGAVHQLRGRVGWTWASWASIMGLLFGAVFLATGSLLGPMLAHAVINIVNLRFVRDTDVEPRKPRRLGGLLASRG